jgi:hypothetical protein
MMLMKYRSCFGVAIMALFFVWALSGWAGDHIDRQIWIEKGKDSLAPFKKRLMGALAYGLEEGPGEAISVCQMLAPEIAEELSSSGVEIGRTSHKLRNPGNLPKKWMQPLLDNFVAAEGRPGPEVVTLADGGVGYVEPIYVKRMCLTCHGSDLSPELASRIDEHYPEDKARGFEEGDFRGLFWVEFKETAEENK